MGYEVLDSHARQDEPDRPDGPPTGHTAARPRNVVALEPNPEGAGPASAPPAPVRRVADLAVAAAHGRHRASILAGAALAFGALAGGAVGSTLGGSRALHSAERAGAMAEERSQQRTLAVVAYANDVVRYLGAGGRTALLDVRVTNAGPRSVEVVVTPAWIEARPGHPVVRQNSPSPVIQPTGDVNLVMTVLAACGDPSARTPTVPVRTQDGTVHAVPIRSTAGILDLTADCPR
jgi:hypothetical protein